jgi:hypothetical protein
MENKKKSHLHKIIYRTELELKKLVKTGGKR